VCDSVDERCAAFAPCSRFGPNTRQQWLLLLILIPWPFCFLAMQEWMLVAGRLTAGQGIICDIVHATRDHWRVMLRTPLLDLTTGFMTFAVYHPSACPHPSLTLPRTCFPRTRRFLLPESPSPCSWRQCAPGQRQGEISLLTDDAVISEVTLRRLSISHTMAARAQAAVAHSHAGHAAGNQAAHPACRRVW